MYIELLVRILKSECNPYSVDYYASKWNGFAHFDWFEEYW